MTNLWLAALSTVLTLAILTALWLTHRSLVTRIIAVSYGQLATERTLRSHIVDECNEIMSNVSAHGAAVKREIKSTEESVIDFVATHAADLRKHAEDLRNHAKELTDRAEVQAAAPRQAVTRN